MGRGATRLAGRTASAGRTTGTGGPSRSGRRAAADATGGRPTATATARLTAHAAGA